MINKVDKKTLMDAIDYLFVDGFIEQMNSDQRYYVRALLDKVANGYKIKLKWDEE